MFYAANVSCGQSGKVMYNSRYRLVAVPNKVMLRMVRELKNQGSKKVEEAKTLNSVEHWRKIHSIIPET
jgi:hypothetical protein